MEFPALGIPRNFGDFHSEIFRKNWLIPNDSEPFGIIDSKVQKGKYRYGIPSEIGKLYKMKEKLCRIFSFHIVTSKFKFSAGASTLGSSDLNKILEI